MLGYSPKWLAVMCFSGLYKRRELSPCARCSIGRPALFSSAAKEDIQAQS